MSGRFAVIPIRVLDDERLNITHLRVLMALSSHSDKHGWSYPGSRKLAEMVRLTPGRVRTCIGELRSFGLLEVSARYRDDGSQTTNFYRVVMDGAFEPVAAGQQPIPGLQPPHAADTPPHAAQTPPVCPGADAPRLPKGVRPPSAQERAPLNGPFEGTKVTDQGNEYSPSAAPPVTSKPAKPAEPVVEMFSAEDVVALGADPEHVAVWLLERKKQKASNTMLSLKAMQREAGEAGYTMRQAVQACAERGWRGFRAEYVQAKGQGAKAVTMPRRLRPSQLSEAELNAQMAADRAGIDSGDVIDGEGLVTLGGAE
jgi:hypothetical protein